MVKYIKHTKITKNINNGDYIRNLKINIWDRLIEGQTNGHEVPTMLASKKEKIGNKGEGEGGEKSAITWEGRHC